jgi:DNA-binding MarR family transcriptional regulator
MDSAKPTKRPPGPPSAVLQKIRSRVSESEMQGLQAVFALRAAARQVDTALDEWLGGTAGSFARFHILMAVWAAEGQGIAHKDIAATMRVTRATVSDLMAALDREGFVKSEAAPDDRRKLMAQLTVQGRTVVKKAFETSMARFRAAFASLSEAELADLTALLQRFREGFAEENGPQPPGESRLKQRAKHEGQPKKGQKPLQVP